MSFLDSITSLLKGQYPLVLVRSKIDGKEYKVRDLPDKQKAADLLATLRNKLTTLCDALERKYPEKKEVKLMAANFRSDPERFLEATPDSEHTSSTVNKGESIHMCLRQREGTDETLVDENVMMFVALHEFSHVCNESIGHGPEFWQTFAWILNEAESMKLYQYTDFAAHPVKYCGIAITDSPKYDPAKDGTNFQRGNLYAKVAK